VAVMLTLTVCLPYSLFALSQMGVYVTDGGSAVVTACRFAHNRLHSAEAEGPGSSLQHDLRCSYSPKAQLPVASKGGSAVCID
jgi:hypothetical protein